MRTTAKNVDILRAVVLHDPDLWLKCALAPSQRALYEAVRLRPYGITSRVVADITACSVKCAGKKLKVLYDKGYLSRTIRYGAHGGGGREPIYKAVKF